MFTVPASAVDDIEVCYSLASDYTQLVVASKNNKALFYKKVYVVIISAERMSLSVGNLMTPTEKHDLDTLIRILESQLLYAMQHDEVEFIGVLYALDKLKNHYYKLILKPEINLYYVKLISTLKVSILKELDSSVSSEQRLKINNTLDLFIDTIKKGQRVTLLLHDALGEVQELITP